MAPPRSVPIGLLLLLPLALVLYVLMLVNAVQGPGGSGEERIGAAVEALFVTAGLWIVLAWMMIVAFVTGSMPARAAISAIVLVPMSGVAGVVALDMVSRDLQWALFFPIVLPVLILFYAFWARLAALQGKFKAQRTSMAIWAAVLVLSVAALVFAALF
jgi:hypothetical protein